MDKYIAIWFLSMDADSWSNYFADSAFLFAYGALVQYTASRVLFKGLPTAKGMGDSSALKRADYFAG